MEDSNPTTGSGTPSEEAAAPSAETSPPPKPLSPEEKLYSLVSDLLSRIAATTKPLPLTYLNALRSSGDKEAENLADALQKIETASETLINPAKADKHAETRNSLRMISPTLKNAGGILKELIGQQRREEDIALEKEAGDRKAFDDKMEERQQRLSDSGEILLKRDEEDIKEVRHHHQLMRAHEHAQEVCAEIAACLDEMLGPDQSAGMQRGGPNTPPRPPGQPWAKKVG